MHLMTLYVKYALGYVCTQTFGLMFKFVFRFIIYFPVWKMIAFLIVFTLLFVCIFLNCRVLQNAKPGANLETQPMTSQVQTLPPPTSPKMSSCSSSPAKKRANGLMMGILMV